MAGKRSTLSWLFLVIFGPLIAPSPYPCGADSSLRIAGAGR
ncbi:MAG: hypothetical protein AVDCRST_MAG10-2621 [uncultured Acidimicrobiales bacterium]|uniref:Uncharacterized protein n=1 Tax=uncultured Acidimicrobiales bacterium TaxID=310071 RepID=A0A6J4ITG8_9ACTN|nr:MAG: hypothetical protein AVDCRST_MAG10-2621 [uncultured Acidimicrobiales bacterium]